MAITNYDFLAKITGDVAANSRKDTCLWFYLLSNGIILNPGEFGGIVMRDRMADGLNYRPDLIPNVNSILSQLMLRDEHLAWIKDNKRQHRWLLSRFQKVPELTLQSPPANLLGRDLIIAMIDVWRTEQNSKAKSIKNLEIDWIYQEQNDVVFRWFKGKDEVQRCVLAWEWLRKNKAPYETKSISGYEELLMLSDRIQWSEIEKAHCVDACKKRWSQKQYRESLQGKKQCNFILSEKAIHQLDMLAETYNLKRPQILEVLIKMEAEINTYLPIEMKRRGI